MEDRIYEKQLLEYAEERIRIKLKKKGIITDDIERVYVIYARKSTKGKRKDKKGKKIERQERSVPDQISACQNMAKSMGIKPIRIFKDEQTAKKPGLRDDFTDMLKGIKAGKFNSIISWHPDRLARNMKDAGEIIDLLDRGLIVDLKFPQYTFVRDASGVMTLGIQFVLAKQYSDNLSINTTRGSVNIAKEGKSPQNIPKRGYRMVNQRFRPDGQNFELLCEAFDMALNKIPLDTIAKHLNDNGFEFRNQKLTVRKQMLSEIFADTFYTGLYVFGSTPVDLRIEDPGFKPMISPLEFMQLRNQYDEAIGFKPQRTKIVLFREMVICGHCNRMMTPSTPRSGGKGQRRYLRITCANNLCPTRLKKELKRDFRSMILFDYIEKILNDGFDIDRKSYESYLKDLKSGSHIYKHEYMRQVKAIDRSLAECDDKKTELTKSLGNAKGATIDELNGQIDEVREQIVKHKMKRREVMKTITSIDAQIEKDNTYEKFLNFFNNIVLIIRNSDNQYLVDSILKMVFLNFTVKDRIVLSHQFNPDFLKYVKVKSVMLCRQRAKNLELLTDTILTYWKPPTFDITKVILDEKHRYEGLGNGGFTYQY